MSKAETTRLTEAQWKDREYLRQHWDAFCEADTVPEDFIHRMSGAGFISIRGVRKSDLEEPFAAERGIAKGGHLWELTRKGQRIYNAA